MTPPLTDKSIDPVEKPVHKTATLFSVELIGEGWANVMDCSLKQPFARDTKTVYVPALKFEIFGVVALLDHP